MLQNPNIDNDATFDNILIGRIYLAILPKENNL